MIYGPDFVIGGPSADSGASIAMSPIRFILFFPALFLSGMLCSGCGGGKPNPISSNISYGPEDEFATRILDRSQRREVLSIMKGSVIGPTDDPAHSAPFGVRWRDVHAAAIAAGAKYELAVLSVQTDAKDELKTVELISIRESPVKLLVRRAAPPEIYTATVTAGLFENDTKLADDFLDAFNVSMRAFGRKPGWSELQND